MLTWHSVHPSSEVEVEGEPPVDVVTKGEDETPTMGTGERILFYSCVQTMAGQTNSGWLADRRHSL